MAGDLRVFANPVAAAEAAAALLIDAIGAAHEGGRGFRLVAAGGSTPIPAYAAMARAPIDWTEVEVFFGDERCVPPEHEDSNHGMVHRALLARIDGRKPTVHRIEAELDAEEAAARYDRLLRSKQVRGRPLFDAVLLGMGADGHTASLFPETAALEDTQRLCVCNDVPQLAARRITLTFTALNAANLVLFLVAGAAKANAMRRAREPAGTAPPLPVHGVQPRGELIWCVDRAALV